MEHDRQLLRDARGICKPYDSNGNFVELWNLNFNRYDRVFFSRFFYKWQVEPMDMFLFEDGSVMIRDMRNEVLYHSF